MSAYNKAIVAFFVPAAVILGEAVTDGRGPETPTAGEWVLAFCACVLTSAGVFTVRNR